jgi:mono/diheme cytochrome c family protein
LIYYYGWDRLTPGRHLVVGWIYFGAAWFSMVVINGILSFQMTPGRWIETHAFWDGFLNPTYVPSLVTRTFFAFGLAGLFAVLTGSLTRDVAFKRRLLRYSGLWTVIPMAGVVLGGIWWWSAIPEAVTGSVAGATAGAMPFATAITAWIPAAGLVFVALVLLGPILLPRLVDPVSAMAITLIGLAVMGGGEWIREAVRKPYIIYDYMYVNGIRKADAAEIAREGYAANARWIRAGHASATPDSSAATSSAATSSAAASLAAASSAAAPPAQTPAAATPSVPIFSPPTLGEQVFRIACMNCHARRGYNGLAEPVLGWDHEFAQGVVKRLEHVRGSMPPWLGTDGEAGAVADFLVSLNPPGAALALPRDRLAAGRLLFESRCGICHTVSKFRGVRELVEGLSAEEIDAFMQDMESDQMPPFTGTDEQRMMLAEHLAALGSSPSPGGR